MKVLWLSHLIPYPPKGGVLQRTFNMIKEVGKYHEITLVTFNQSQFLEASLPDNEDPVAYATTQLSNYVKSIYVLDIPENNIIGGRYITLLKSLLKARAYNMEWLRSKKAKQVIQELLFKETFDIIHLDTISLCVYADLFGDIPYVLNHHNFESQMLQSRVKTETNILKKLYFRYEAAQLIKSEKHFCRSSDLNITCSDEDSDSMKSEINGGEFVTVPNGVDITYFFPNRCVERKEKSIVIVGGLSWYPNREAVEHFIHNIWPLLKIRIPGISVSVVGRHPTDEMKKLSEDDPFFHVHGFVDDVRDYLWKAQFYICPIRTGGGTKLKILDALASGCCIIADPFACKGIKVENGKNVVYARTPEEYVYVIQELLHDSKYEDRIREAGPRLIQSEYNYTKIGQNYSKNIKYVVEQRTNQRKRDGY